MRAPTRFAAAGAAALTIGLVAVPAALGRPKPPPTQPSPSQTKTTKAAANNFSFGQLNLGAGCGTNGDGEPAVRSSYDDNVVVASERGLGGGSDAWHGPGTATACGLSYAGQPNAVASSGVGASGGDVDIAIGSQKAVSGQYPVYVSSLNLASVSVATSTDGGATYTNVPVQAGLPGDDREWIAAFGSQTALLSFHDLAGEIDVLRSDNQGQTFQEISRAIAPTDPNATNNEIGNLAIDRVNTTGAAPGQFWAYQSYAGASPGNSSGSTIDEAFVAVSSDGGTTWTDRGIPCSSTSSTVKNGLDHNFVNVSVAPNGTVWMAWSDDTGIFTASSPDHGQTWTCSPAVSTNTKQAIFPWIVAGSAGVDLVYYGATSGASSSQPWYVYFAQNALATTSGWATPQQLVEVHKGTVCESGATCTTGRQLFDDFGVTLDTSGLAHIAYSQDAPTLGGSGTSTGYAVQTAGSTVGKIN